VLDIVGCTSALDTSGIKPDTDDERFIRAVNVDAETPTDEEKFIRVGFVLSSRSFALE